MLFLLNAKLSTNGIDLKISTVGCAGSTPNIEELKKFDEILNDALLTPRSTINIIKVVQY